MYLSKFINFEKSNLIVVAGPPTVGKTSATVATVKELRKKRKTAYFYFLDDKKFIEEKDMNNIFVKLRDFYSVEKLREKCIRLKNKYDIKFIVIDDIELLRCEKAILECKSILDEQEETARYLKDIVKELDISILVVSLLSPRFYKRKDEEDLLLYLENKTFKKCADVIIFLYKENYTDENISTKIYKFNEKEI